MRYLFTLYRKKSNNGTTIWHARIWDATLKKYAFSRSTGVLVEGRKERRREAEEAARKLYEEFAGIEITVTQPTATTPLVFFRHFSRFFAF
jgi:hypothetical protein